MQQPFNIPYWNLDSEGSEHIQFDSPRLVKREAGFPNPRRRWLAQTNHNAITTHNTTDNRPVSQYFFPLADSSRTP